ncbi:MAG: hypothetical protein KQJ78_03655 [Deltaproteobacteria bacterium]|nr:hypothetical protein [Deltaproteobacteria bacterium]
MPLTRIGAMNSGQSVSPPAVDLTQRQESQEKLNQLGMPSQVAREGLGVTGLAEGSATSKVSELGFIRAKAESELYSKGVGLDQSV